MAFMLPLLLHSHSHAPVPLAAVLQLPCPAAACQSGPCDLKCARAAAAWAAGSGLAPVVLQAVLQLPSVMSCVAHALWAVHYTLCCNLLQPCSHCSASCAGPHAAHCAFPTTLIALQRVLHTVLQIAAAMLLSFINGVVASPYAFGPLATTYHALFTSTVPQQVPVLYWMRVIAAASMGCGSALWSRRLVAVLGGCCVRRCRPPLVDT